jgi:cytochrome c oxidase subunit 2
MSEMESGAAEGQLPNLHVDRYEAGWMRIAFFVIVVFVIAVVISSVSYGVQVPGMTGRIDPATLMTPPSPFADPQLREIAPGKYELYVRAQTWTFVPLDPLKPLRLPAGSEVTFYATSLDVQHGFKITGTNINMMVLPGQISTLKARFEDPGTYNVICHEYCGSGGTMIGHHTMYGQIIIEDAATAAAD